MEIRVTSRHTEISDEIRKYLENKVKKLEKYFSRIVEIHAILDKEKYRCSVEVAIQTNTGKIVAQHENQDMLSSIDLVINKLERQLKKLKEKRRDLKRGGKEDKYLTTPEVLADQTVKQLPKISDVNKIFLEKMTIDDAVLKLNSIKRNLFVFLNSSTENINLLHKNQDGSISLTILEIKK